MRFLYQQIYLISFIKVLRYGYQKVNNLRIIFITFIFFTFYVNMCQNKVQCKISRKQYFLISLFFNILINTFIYRIIKSIILCKKIIQFYLKKVIFISFWCLHLKKTTRKISSSKSFHFHLKHFFISSKISEIFQMVDLSESYIFCINFISFKFYFF